MKDLKEMEALFKAGVNRAAIKAYLQNAAILRDPKASSKMKEVAAANVKAISNNQPMPKQQSAAPKAKPQPKEAPAMEFHEVFARHHGIDPAQFKSTWHAMSPEQQKVTQEWHAEQVAKPAQPPKVPTSSVVSTATQPLKVVKSIDSLYDLFVQLRKHL